MKTLHEDAVIIQKELREIRKLLAAILSPPRVFEVDPKNMPKDLLHKLGKGLKPGAMISVTPKEMKYIIEHPTLPIFVKEQNYDNKQPSSSSSRNNKDKLDSKARQEHF